MPSELDGEELPGATVTLTPVGAPASARAVSGKTPCTFDLERGRARKLEVSLAPRAGKFSSTATTEIRADRNGTQTWRGRIEVVRGPAEGQAWTVPELGLELVPIQAGSFQMGSDNSGTQAEDGLAMKYRVRYLQKSARRSLALQTEGVPEHILERGTPSSTRGLGVLQEPRVFSVPALSPNGATTYQPRAERRAALGTALPWGSALKGRDTPGAHRWWRGRACLAPTAAVRAAARPITAGGNRVGCFIGA